MENWSMSELPRRKFVKLTGTGAGVTALAGCSGNGSDGGDGGSGDDGNGSDGGSGDGDDGGSSDYPSEAIEIVAWASPGGGSDIICRQGYQRAIEENDLLPVNTQVTNQSGGGGEAGMQYTLNQPADGYTILNVTTNLVITPLSRELDVGYESFSPVALMGTEPIVLAIRSDDDRYSNAEEFIEYGQENRVTIASFDVGTQDHTAALLLGQETGMDAEIVPYSGGGEQLSALLGGDVDAAVSAPSEVQDQEDLDIILHFSEEEVEVLPDTPYVSQVTDAEIRVEQMRGTVVHGDTDQSRVDYLVDLFEEIQQTDEFQEYYENNSVNPAFRGGEEFLTYIEDMQEQYDQVFQENNLGIYSDD